MELSSKLWTNGGKQSTHQDSPIVGAHQLLDKSPERAEIVMGSQRDQPCALADNILTEGTQNLLPKVDSVPVSATNIRWTEVVAKPFRPASLNFVQPIFIEGNKLQLPCGLAQLGEEKWKNCLTGYFIEKALPFSLVKEQATRLWHKYGLMDTL